jgi:hypothetical protein
MVTPRFEIVHTCPDWYDGPRQGIADYEGRPHLFQSEWQAGEAIDADTFLLMPIDRETFQLALESWSIWLRWEAALFRGETSEETHPALPGDRLRHEEVERQLKGRLEIDLSRSVRMRAEFRGTVFPFHGDFHLEVQWKALDGTESNVTHRRD